MVECSIVKLCQEEPSRDIWTIIVESSRAE